MSGILFDDFTLTATVPGGGGGGGTDAGTPDAGTPDAGTPDAGPPDAGAPDAGAPDAGPPDAGTTGGINLTVSTTYTVWPWSGFFSPVNNPPTLNGVNSGQAIPVKFGLGGNRGMQIFAAGYPKSQQVPRKNNARRCRCAAAAFHHLTTSVHERLRRLPNARR